MNQQAEELKKKIDGIIDAWAHDLLHVRLQGNGNSASPKPRGLWDKVKSGFYGFLHGDTKKNPYYFKNRFGDYLGSANENLSNIGLRDYALVKHFSEKTENTVVNILNEDSELEKLRLFRIVRQAASELKANIHKIIDGMEFKAAAGQNAATDQGAAADQVAADDQGAVPSQNTSASQSTAVNQVPADDQGSESNQDVPVVQSAGERANQDSASGSSSASSGKRRTAPVKLPKKMDQSLSSNPVSAPQVPRKSDSSSSSSSLSEEVLTKKHTALLKLFADIEKINKESASDKSKWLLKGFEIRENMGDIYDALRSKIDDSKKSLIAHQMHDKTKANREELIDYLPRFFKSFGLPSDQIIEAIDSVFKDKKMPELDKDTQKSVLASLGWK